MPDSLFERIGGEGADNTAVDIFYHKVLSDSSISHFSCFLIIASS